MDIRDLIVLLVAIVVGFAASQVVIWAWERRQRYDLEGMTVAPVGHSIARARLDAEFAEFCYPLGGNPLDGFNRDVSQRGCGALAGDSLDVENTEGIVAEEWGRMRKELRMRRVRTPVPIEPVADRRPAIMAEILRLQGELNDMDDELASTPGSLDDESMDGSI